MQEKSPFIEHFYELRQRLAKVAAILLIGIGIGYGLRHWLQKVLVAPLHQPLYYTTPGGGFDFIVKICIFFGILVATPVAVYQVFKFIEPTLKKDSTKFIHICGIASVVLVVLGVLFGYYVTLPAALHFLGEFSNGDVQQLITTSSYFSFVMTYLAGFGLLFQIPVIVLFINRIKPINPRKMLKSERWVVLISFVVAAIITPTPDPLNQLLMAAPIILLYNASLALTLLANKNRKKHITLEPSSWGFDVSELDWITQAEIEDHTDAILRPFGGIAKTTETILPKQTIVKQHAPLQVAAAKQNAVSTTVRLKKPSIDGMVSAKTTKPEPVAPPVSAQTKKPKRIVMDIYPTTVLA